MSGQPYGGGIFSEYRTPNAPYYVRAYRDFKPGTSLAEITSNAEEALVAQVTAAGCAPKFFRLASPAWPTRFDDNKLDATPLFYSSVLCRNGLFRARVLAMTMEGQAENGFAAPWRMFMNELGYFREQRSQGWEQVAGQIQYGNQSLIHWNSVEKRYDDGVRVGRYRVWPLPYPAEFPYQMPPEPYELFIQHNQPASAAAIAAGMLR